MKFQPDTLDGVNVITRQEAGRLFVGATPWTQSVIVPWKGDPLAWGASGFDSLTAEHFERIAALQPEVVIFGSGARLQFAPPALLRSLIERRIGIESMDTAAASRTYNVLANEGRTVVAALLLDAAG